MTYSDELYHHGVKGQKWGVRRAEKYAKAEQKWAQKEEKRKTRLGKNLATYNKLSYRLAKENQQAANKSTTLKGKLQNKYGMEAQARNQKHTAEFHDTRASRAKTQRARTRLESQAYNARQAASVSRSVAKGTSSTTRRNIRYNAAMWNTPAKTARGKKTTFGKQAIKATALAVAYAAAQEYAKGKMEDW